MSRELKAWLRVCIQAASLRCSCCGFCSSEQGTVLPVENTLSAVGSEAVLPNCLKMTPYDQKVHKCRAQPCTTCFSLSDAFMLCRIICHVPEGAILVTGLHRTTPREHVRPMRQDGSEDPQHLDSNPVEPVTMSLQTGT